MLRSFLSARLVLSFFKPFQSGILPLSSSTYKHFGPMEIVPANSVKRGARNSAMVVAANQLANLFRDYLQLAPNGRGSRDITIRPVPGPIASGSGRRSSGARRPGGRRRRRGNSETSTADADFPGITVRRNIRTPPFRIRSTILWPVTTPTGGGNTAQFLQLGHFATAAADEPSLGTVQYYSGGSLVNEQTTLNKFTGEYRLYRIKRVSAHFMTSMGSTTTGTVGFGYDRNPAAGLAAGITSIARLDIHSIVPLRGSGGMISWTPLPEDGRPWKVVNKGTSISVEDGSYGRIQLYTVNSQTTSVTMGHLVIDVEIEYAEPWS